MGYDAVRHIPWAPKSAYTVSVAATDQGQGTTRDRMTRRRHGQPRVE